MHLHGNPGSNDNDGQMIFGEPWGPKASRHLSYRLRKNPEKTLPRKFVPTGDRTWARSVTGAHDTTCSTAVDS